MKTKKTTRCFSAAATALAVSLLTGCGHRTPPAGDGASTVPIVSTVILHFETLQQTLPVSGTLSALPNEEATLTPQVSGTLQSFNVSFGQTVRRGQPIAEISTQQISQQIIEAQATLGQSEVQVEQAQANALQQEAQTRAAILQAKSNVRSAQATLAGYEAVLDADSAGLVNSQQNLARQQTLFGEGLVSRKDVESAELDIATAKAADDSQTKQIQSQQESIDALTDLVDAAKTGTLQDLVKRKDIEIAQQQVANSFAALNALKSQESLYTLRSPLDGRITAIGASVGELVDSTTRLATIDNLSRLQLSMGVPSGELSNLRTGQTVMFTSDLMPGKIFKTAIGAISPQIDPATGAAMVLAEIDNADGRLDNNMTVSATIQESDSRNVLVVPESAVLNDADTGSRSAAMVGPDSILHIVPITTGLSANGATVVTDGLAAGDRVAVSGQYGLTDGTKVAVEAADSGQATLNGS